MPKPASKSPPAKPGGEAGKAAKGVTYYLCATCPAGRALVREVARRVKKQLGL